MENDDYKVRLDIFEGPMDLLIYLIKKAEVDIYDIPIALITDQYLAYLEWMKSMNIDFAGDFLVMAATLTQIKSRMLLPVHEELDDAEDPRMEIARPLLEYLQIKAAAEALLTRNLLGEKTFTRKADFQEASIPLEDREIRVGLFELIEAFQVILERAAGEHTIDFTAERMSVRDRIAEIVDILEARGSVTFSDLFPFEAARADIVVTFLAVLEMARLNLLRVVQNVQSGTIRLFYL